MSAHRVPRRSARLSGLSNPSPSLLEAQTKADKQDKNALAKEDKPVKDEQPVKQAAKGRKSRKSSLEVAKKADPPMPADTEMEAVDVKDAPKVKKGRRSKNAELQALQQQNPEQQAEKADAAERPIKLRRSRRISLDDTRMAVDTRARASVSEDVEMEDADSNQTKLENGPQKRKRSSKPELTREIEREYWELGFQRVAGVDEAGRGPLAGPVVAAACIIPPDVQIPGIQDSKQLTEAKREEIYEQLMQHDRIQCCIEVVDTYEIDRINILQATLKAMEGAVVGMPGGKPDFFLFDGTQVPKGLDEERCRAIVKGDTKCLPIAAASILAKVTRDRLMVEYDQKYPQYGFALHKGYGTKAHFAAIQQFGQCPIHRVSFKLKNGTWGAKE